MHDVAARRQADVVNGRFNAILGSVDGAATPRRGSALVGGNATVFGNVVSVHETCGETRSGRLTKTIDPHCGPHSSSPSMERTYFVITDPTVSGSGAFLDAGNGSWTWNNPSDRRLKQDITPLTDVLRRVLELRPVFYRFKSSLMR